MPEQRVVLATEMLGLLDNHQRKSNIEKWIPQRVRYAGILEYDRRGTSVGRTSEETENLILPPTSLTHTH